MTDDLTLTNATFPISDKTTSEALAAHTQACADFWRDVEALHADRLKVLSGAMQTTVAALQAQASELNARRSALIERRRELLWDRHALINQLAPFAQQAVEKADAEYERVVQAETDYLAMAGVTTAAMPAAFVNAKAAAQQLRVKVQQLETCLSCRGLANEAKATAAAYESWRSLLPTERRAAIAWREGPQGLVGALGKLLGI